MICYSLGNFLTYGNVNIKGINGKGVIMNITIDQKTGDFLNGEIFPTKQRSFGITHFDREKSAISLIKNLSKSDFPNSKLEISDDGNITLKN